MPGHIQSMCYWLHCIGWRAKAKSKPVFEYKNRLNSEEVVKISYCRLDRSSLGHYVLIQPVRHKMLNNSHSLVNRSTPEPLSEHIDTKCKHWAFYNPPEEDRWQKNVRWWQIVFTALNCDGCRFSARVSPNKTQTKWLKTQTLKHNGLKIADVTCIRDLSSSKKTVYRRDLRANPCVYLPRRVLDRWTD